MKVAIMGAGNVGGALALSWIKSSHEITIGARNMKSDKVTKVSSMDSRIKVESIDVASKEAEVVLIAASPAGRRRICKAAW